jgi:hypothetical protein
MRALCILLCALAAGTAAAGGKSTNGGKSAPVMGAAPATTQSGGGGGHGGGGVVAIGTAALAGRTAYVDPRQVPPMDPQREVVEVDCTKPVDFTRGNLKCK